MDATTRGKLREVISDLSAMITRTATEGNTALARDLDACLSSLRNTYWRHTAPVGRSPMRPRRPGYGS
jgi:hypothetical protein